MSAPHLETAELRSTQALPRDEEEDVLKRAKETWTTYKRELEATRKRVHELTQQMNQTGETLQRLYESHAYNGTRTPQALRRHRKGDTVTPQIRSHIAQCVLHEGMRWVDAMKEFDISRSTLARIIQEWKSKEQDPSYQRPLPKKRGRISALDNDSVVSVSYTHLTLPTILRV
eukprot:TRINITY_DN4110_c0_g1_i1.p1 TRINITY_DN4110_c0_g1~~TRINITY_DN4110_c0_g1_i1.p1  ORF type:complete len:173 (+),score=16.08 TRINITY_DN4110_c0_g1_i1:137-655(+)